MKTTENSLQVPTESDFKRKDHQYGQSLLKKKTKRLNIFYKDLIAFSMQTLEQSFKCSCPPNKAFNDG